MENLKSAEIVQTLPMLSQELLPERCNKLLKSFPGKMDFLVHFNFDNCVQKFSGFNTAELALQSGKMKMREIAQAYDKQTPVSMIELWLCSLAKYSGIDATDQQVKEIAIYLYEDNSFFNLAEMTLFFKRLKKGFYDELYGRFDGMKIVAASREYRIERGNILSRLTYEEQLKLIK